MSPLYSIDDLKAHLEPLIERHEDSAVVFDADGTLWSHDVGCMVYDKAVSEGLFREAAFDALAKEARERGVGIEARNANEVARALQEAWYERRYDERAAAEMQVWAYVGFTEQEFRELVTLALEKGNHTSTLHDPVLELAEWVRRQGARTCVVSASPLWVVQEATRSLGFPEDEIAAGIPNTSQGERGTTIAPGMASPLPYGPDKVVAGRALLGKSSWLAALGDSDFDLHMMAEAQIGVGIGQKASMLEGLTELSHGVRLALD